MFMFLPQFSTAKIRIDRNIFNDSARIIVEGVESDSMFRSAFYPFSNKIAHYKGISV